MASEGSSSVIVLVPMWKGRLQHWNVTFLRVTDQS